MRLHKTILCFLACLIAFASCNPAKQVLKRQEQFDQVGKAWAKKNPCVNDSTTTVLPGRVDSIPYPVGVIDSSLLKTFADSIKIAIAKKFNRNVEDCNGQVNEAFNVGYAKANDEWQRKKYAVKQPDTLKITVPDKRALNIKIEEIDLLNKQLIELKDSAQKFKNQRNYAYMGIGILLIIGLVIALIKSKL